MSDRNSPSAQVRRIHKLLREQKLCIATAESMTAGGISARLASVSGASDVLMGGLVVYMQQMKTKLPGLTLEEIEGRGAESKETTKAMAEGLLEWIPEANVVLAITGAAPSTNTRYATSASSGSVFVCIGLREGECTQFETQLKGNRVQVLNKAVQFALNCLEEVLLGNRQFK